MNYLRGFSLNAVCTGLTFSLGLVNHWLLANHLLDKAAYGRLTLWTSAAMIGAIVLTLRHRADVKRQNVVDQMMRDPKLAMKLNDVKPGQGL